MNQGKLTSLSFCSELFAVTSEFLQQFGWLIVDRKKNCVFIFPFMFFYHFHLVIYYIVIHYIYKRYTSSIVNQLNSQTVSTNKNQAQRSKITLLKHCHKSLTLLKHFKTLCLRYTVFQTTSLFIFFVRKEIFCREYLSLHRWKSFPSLYSSLPFSFPLLTLFLKNLFQ